MFIHGYSIDALKDKGFDLVVHESIPAKVKASQDKDAARASSPAEVAHAVERTTSTVGTAARAAARARWGARHHPRHPRGCIVVSMGTIDSPAAKGLSGRLAVKEVKILDAPMSGGLLRTAS
jgi:3-hydroxyisobutyrate dehydrogenase-like beta-hydroxyacid dehydrogenase